jgi:metallo-beta-lactamase family protein
MSNLTFYGGASTVTGANFLLESEDIRILVDCGLVQDRKVCHGCNYDDFQYDPKTVDVLLVTHAHLDHIGRIPKLVRDGFSGIIYSTPSTREISETMFHSGMSLMRNEAKYEGKEPLYNEKDVEKTMKLWKEIPYREEFELAANYSVFAKDAGHILGSCIFEICHKTSSGSRKIAFTGDLGNSPTPLLKDTEPLSEDVDYVVMESVYGDRNHETTIDERKDEFTRVVKESIARGGTLLLPVFSIERTQIMLHELNGMVEGGEIESVPVYLDSPLAIKVTDIYRKYIHNFKQHVQNETKTDDDIFDFPRLKLTITREDSKDIIYTKGPKIILAGSGMSHGGRIMFHEKIYLSDPKNTICFVGYQVPGTLGRQIQDGNKVVEIFKKKVKVKAHVETISGFSAHKDSDGLLQFIEPVVESVEKVFLAMGEPKSSMFLAQRFRDYYEVDAIVPTENKSFEIDF